MANHAAEPILTALHYLFSRSSNGRIVAHCLDLDLVTSAESITTAEESLNAIVLMQIASCFTSGNFGQLKFKAPSEYWETLSKSREIEISHLEVEVPPVVLPVKKSFVNLPVYRHETEELLAA